MPVVFHMRNQWAFLLDVNISNYIMSLPHNTLAIIVTARKSHGRPSHHQTPPLIQRTGRTAPRTHTRPRQAVPPHDAAIQKGTAGWHADGRDSAPRKPTDHHRRCPYSGRTGRSHGHDSAPRKPLPTQRPRYYSGQHAAQRRGRKPRQAVTTERRRSHGRKEEDFKS